VPEQTQTLKVDSPTGQRRLAVVAVLDIVGYSRMIGVDDEGTVERWRRLREEVIATRIAAARARVVRSTGDGLLIEFPSALEAVRCTVDIQRAAREWNQALSDDRHILMRIGVAMGDVMHDSGDLFGEGVNIAERLQAMADPGAVLIAANVHEQVVGRLEAEFVELGELALRNITHPVRTYRIGGERRAPQLRVTRADEHPSIVVLPFTNVGGNSAQDYLIDGIVEEVTMSLAHLRWLKVIARSAAFTLKGQTIDVRRIAQDFGVRYVLAGSARSSGQQVRVTAELIEAPTAAQLWSDRFTGDLTDVFALQDQIAERVVVQLQPRLQAAEIARARTKPTESLDAYDFYLQALPHRDRFTPEANREAMRLLNKAIALDQNFAVALALASMCYTSERDQGWAPPDPARIAEGVRLARAAIAADGDDPVALSYAGHTIASLAHDAATGLANIEKAVRLCPNYADAWGRASMVRVYAGDLQGAINAAKRCLELTPVGPDLFVPWCAMGFAYLFQARYDEAIEAAEMSLKGRQRTTTALRIIVAALSLKGSVDAARARARQLLQVDPSLRVSAFEGRTPLRQREHLEIMSRGLRAAGIPE
jgi:adenylate cyclase